MPRQRRRYIIEDRTTQKHWESWAGSYVVFRVLKLSSRYGIYCGHFATVAAALAHIRQRR